MDEPIAATLNIVKASILTIDTADLYLQLSQPVNSIEFSVTYDPNVFAFLPDSVQCALPLSKADTSTPGVVSFKFESNAPDASANTVRFSFRPLMPSRWRDLSSTACPQIRSPRSRFPRSMCLCSAQP